MKSRAQVQNGLNSHDPYSPHDSSANREGDKAFGLQENQSDSLQVVSGVGEMSVLDDKCVKCGESVRRLALLAMMVDAGAKCWPYPLDCAGGGQHDFTPKPIQHDSDCATHNEPAYPNGPCDCSAQKDSAPKSTGNNS